MRFKYYYFFLVKYAIIGNIACLYETGLDLRVQSLGKEIDRCSYCLQLTVEVCMGFAFTTAYTLVTMHHHLQHTNEILKIRKSLIGSWKLNQ